MRVLVWLVGTLIRLWAMTLRFRLDEKTRKGLAEPGPCVYMLWHNRLFFTPEIFRRFMRQPGRSMHGLISGSKDGAILAGIFHTVGIQPIRGSSSWRATEALRSIVAVLKQGGDVGITPDGPRGPCYNLEAGALLAAKLGKTPLVLLGIAPGKSRRLKSWDRFYLPLPFSRVELRLQKYASYDAFVEAAGSDATGQARQRLLELSQVDEADIPPRA